MTQSSIDFASCSPLVFVDNHLNKFTGNKLPLLTLSILKFLLLVEMLNINHSHCGLVIIDICHNFQVSYNF